MNLDSQQVSLDGGHISFPTMPAGLTMVPHEQSEWLFEFVRQTPTEQGGFYVWVDSARYPVDRMTWRQVQELVTAL